MSQNQDELVSVTVAKRRTIQHRLKKGDQMKIFREGETVEVPRWDVARLLRQGFIVDPDEKELTQAQIDSAGDASAYLPKSGDVKINEDTDQKVLQPQAGNRRGNRAA